jgi:hypothetical protein
VHADRGVAGTGPARDHGDAGLAGELAVGFRHVGGARLVARVDQRDSVLHVVERIEHFQVALARHAERHVGAVDQQLIHQDAAAAARGRLGDLRWVRAALVHAHVAAFLASPCHRRRGAAT